MDQHRAHAMNASPAKSLLTLGRVLLHAMAVASVAFAAFASLVRLPHGFRFGPGSMVVNPSGTIRELAAHRWLKRTNAGTRFVLCEESAATHAVTVWQIGTYIGLPFPVATRYESHLRVSALMDDGLGRYDAPYDPLSDHADEVPAIWAAVRADTTIHLALPDTVNARGEGEVLVHEPWGYVANGATLVSVGSLVRASATAVRRGRAARALTHARPDAQHLS